MAPRKWRGRTTTPHPDSERPWAAGCRASRSVGDCDRSGSQPCAPAPASARCPSLGTPSRAGQATARTGARPSTATAVLRQLLAELPQQQKDTNGLGCVLPLGRTGECPIGRPSLRAADGAVRGLRREAAQVGAGLLDAGWPRAVRLPLLREDIQECIRQGALQVRPHVFRRRPQRAPRRAASGLQPSRLPGATAAVSRRASAGGHREDELHERLKHHHPQ
mmetsp:Transcript_72956/g.205521  ORF Transcript_72956/g.205521 Transcript_72956/m.205521 type:complete len:221 (-) Transcript_72956:1531-2193(-)